MNANELRIGNKVLFEEDATIFEVLQIQSNGLLVKNYNEQTWIEIECFAGIPLTPELLEKCGFPKSMRDWDYIFDLGILTVIITHSGKIMVWVENIRVARPVQYIHELQNIFHAFTGKDLTTTF